MTFLEKVSYIQSFEGGWIFSSSKTFWLEFLLGFGWLVVKKCITPKNHPYFSSLGKTCFLASISFLRMCCGFSKTAYLIPLGMPLYCIVLLKWSVVRRETGQGPSLPLYNHIIHFSKPSTKQQSTSSSGASCQKTAFPLLPSGPQSLHMPQTPHVSQK